MTSKLSLADEALVKNGTVEDCLKRMKELATSSDPAMASALYEAALLRHGRIFEKRVTEDARNRLISGGLNPDMVDVLLGAQRGGDYPITREVIAFLNEISTETNKENRQTLLGNVDICEGLSRIDVGLADQLGDLLNIGIPGTNEELRLTNTLLNLQQRVQMGLLCFSEVGQRGGSPKPEEVLINLLRNFVLISRAPGGYTLKPVQMYQMLEQAVKTVQSQLDHLYDLPQESFTLNPDGTVPDAYKK